jgi:hypothetical protein
MHHLGNWFNPGLFQKSIIQSDQSATVSVELVLFKFRNCIKTDGLCAVEAQLWLKSE